MQRPTRATRRTQLTSSKFKPKKIRQTQKSHKSLLAPPRLADAVQSCFEGLERRQLLSTYYVNDNWVEQVNSAPGGTIGVVEPGDIVMTAPGDFPAINSLVFDVQAHATVQNAANKFFVTGLDTIKVISGTYPQALNLTDGPGAHALPLDGLTIEGAQANVDARTRSGQPESIVTTSSVNETGSLWYVDPSVDNVTIDGFTFNGNGAAAGGVLLLDGATDSNAARGILVDSNGVNIKNNIVANFYRRGVQYGFNAAPSGGTVSQNDFNRIGADNILGGTNAGHALLAFASPNFINNDVTNTHNGSYHIQVYPPSTSAITVSGNSITARMAGITLNETHDSIPSITVTNNTVTTDAAGGVGAVLWTIGNGLSFTNNTLSTTAANTTGVQVWAGAAAWDVDVTITGGSISGYTRGVHVTNEADVNGTPTLALNTSSVALSGVTITAGAGGTGVLVEDTAAGTTAVSAAINAGTLINGSVTGTGVLVSGSLAAMTGSGATIRGNAVGIDVNGGNAAVTGQNIYNNTIGVRFRNGGTGTVNNNNFEGGANPDNGTDLRIDSDAGGITGGTLTGNTFAGATYIDQRDDQDLTALRTPGGTNNYNVAGVATTDDFVIESRIFHKPDAPATSGLVTWVANSFFIVPAPVDLPTDNDYLRIKNAIEAAPDGTTINLLGTFDWTKTNAAASWAKGNDEVAGNFDDYLIVIPGEFHDVTITAPGGLGTARIQGPGDLATVNLEGVFDFEGGPNASHDNHNWTFSNLEIFDFDLSIGMFNSGAGSDAFNDMTITNNRIRVAADLSTAAAPADTNQNIGIHLSFGTNQTISDNTIELSNASVNDAGLSAANIGIQSNTSGGAVYDGLLIDNNTINVIGAQAASPGSILGIWENGHAHLSDITISNNDFVQTGTGNNAATNLQRAFRVTSHSSAGSTVAYTNNNADGVNIGFQWLAGQNFSGNQPVQLTGNTLTGVNTGYLVQSNGSANISGGSVTGASGTGVNVASGSTATINNVSFQNLTTAINVAGTATMTNNNFNAGTDNVTDIRLLAGSTPTVGAGNSFGGNVFFIDNQSTTDINLTGYTAAQFEGNDPSTTAGSFVIENVMHHRIDTDLAITNGLITWVANNVYITQPGGGSTDSSIQRGVDALAGGHVVNVQGGANPYVEAVTINKAVTIDGEGNTPSATMQPPVANATLITIGSTTATDDVTIQDMAFDGLANTGEAGIRVNGSADFDTFTVNRSTFTGFRLHGVAVFGNSTTGLSADNVVISNSNFSENGIDQGGAGSIQIFEYNGNVSISNVDVTNTGNDARLGIQLRGVGTGTGANELPMGNVTFNDVVVTGSYRNQFIGFQRYSTATTLSMTDVRLGGATSQLWGTFGALLRFDAVGSGSVTSPATADLGNTYFGGTSGASTTKNDLEFAPDNTFAFLRADASGTTWNIGGTDVAASALTLSQAFAVEDRILHYVDALNGVNTYKGWAEVQNGQAFVTATGPADSIQRGVDVVDNGGTLNVATGTYVEAVTINKSVTIDGEGNTPTATMLPPSAGANTITVTTTNASDDVTIQDMAFDGLANTGGVGVLVVGSADFDTFTVNRSSFTGFQLHGVGVFGNASTGLSADNVVINNSTFNENGVDQGGAGGIQIFEYNGNVSMTNVDVTNTGNDARLGIQMRGVGLGDGTGVLPMGTVSLNDVDISGSYRNQFLGFQRYSTATGLSMTDVKLGGATSQIWGTFGALLRFDAVGTGSVSSPATVNLGNTHFRGVSNASAQPTQIEFAPDNNFAFLRADGTNTIWDLPSGSNLNASALTIAQAYEVEDRILDYPKNLPAAASFKGWVEIQNGKAFVTPTVLGPITGNSITRATEVVDSGGTVHIQSGTYTENVNTSANNVTLSPGSSPGQVTINGNLTLDGNDAVLIEINGLTAGTQHDQFVINGTVTLGGATLNTAGSTITATPGQSVTIIANDASDPVNGFFAAPANGNGNVIIVNGQPFFVFYNGGDGNDVTLTRAPNGTPPGPQPAPAVVFVDDDWDDDSFGSDADGPGGSLGNGTAKGIDQFDNIQDAIDAVAAGGEIRIYGGLYVLSLVVDKSLALLGEDFILAGTGPDGTDDVVINPSSTVTNVLEINSSDVEVAGIVVDGDTVDSRGIYMTHATDTLTGLEIHHNQVQDLNRRGIQTDTYLAEFHIHHNVVQNVAGAADAIGIFNFGGGGIPGTGRILNNTVTGSTVGIGLQQSAGTQVFDNTITIPATGGIGIQDSNPGTGSPPPPAAVETIVNNTVTGGDADSYGIMVINTAMNVLLQENDVTTPGVGMGAYGHFGATVPNVAFDENVVVADTIGIEISTDTFGFNGTQSVSAILTTNDVSSSSGPGILVRDTDGAGGATATANLTTNNVVHNNFIGLDVVGGTVTLNNNTFNTNSTGIRVTGGGSATLTSTTFNNNSVGLVAQNGTATITNPHKIDGIAVGNGGLVTVNAGGSNLIVTTSLTITGTGKMDLNDNDMIIDYAGASPRAAVQGFINSARSGGTWSGNGLTSTAAKNRVPQNTTLGLLEATEYKSIYGPAATFGGEAIDNTSILIKYTYYGDTDFNGQVNFDDYSRTDQGFLNNRTGWLNGDFDGNGVVDFDDYSLIDLAFNTQSGVLRPGAGAGVSASDIVDDASPAPTTGGKKSGGAKAGN